jgi:hypothetical protein
MTPALSRKKLPIGIDFSRAKRAIAAWDLCEAPTAA